MVSCSTSQTDCPLPSLLCGRMYDVEIIGVADHCNSSVPGVTQIQTGKSKDWVMGHTHICVCVYERE